MSEKTLKIVGYWLAFGLSAVVFYLFWGWIGVLPLSVMTGVALAVLAGAKLGFGPVVWLFGKTWLSVWLGMVSGLLFFTFKELYPGTWLPFLGAILAFIIAMVASVLIALKIVVRSPKW